MAAWYRQQMREALSPLIEKWEALLGVKASHVFVQRVNTRWGSCIVHEQMHLLERSHNARFHALMDKSMPNWKHLRAELNRVPPGHVEWEY